MVIEWGLLGGVAVKAAVSSGAAKLAGIGVEKGKTKIFPGELEKAVAAGIAAAKAEDDLYPPSQHLFYRCYENDRDELLAKVIEHSATLAELRKPLEESGNIEVDCLVKVFELVAAELKLQLMAGSLERWVRKFAETYFDRTKAAIVFQVAKEQYLKQLAQRVDDVEFVGIAVAGDEVEKQEGLAQIFVMPDVREELRSNFRQADLFRNQHPRRTIPIPPGQPRPIAGLSYVRPGEPRPIAEGKFNPSAPPFKKPPLPYDWRNIDQQAELLEEQKEWAMRDRSFPRIPAHKVLNQTKNKAVLLGAPGSGKTTLASYFALMLTGKNDPTQIGFEADEDWLPVVVRIRDWVLQPGMGLLTYLRWHVQENLFSGSEVKALPVGFFEHWLDRGKALILLDGLDEVVDEAQRQKVTKEIETFLHLYRDNPAVITSRPAGYRRDTFTDEFPHYTLEPFDKKQQDAFIEHWYDSRVPNDKAKADRLKANLRKAFKGNDRIQLLAENPLLLTIIALIHRYQSELPRRRFKLYEKAVETLLTSWDSGKELKHEEYKNNGKKLELLKPGDFLCILNKVAYWIHCQGGTGDSEGGTLINKDELIRQLSKEIRKIRSSCQPHEARNEANFFLAEFIRKRTGLLNEQGTDQYAFVHKTFQEYLTAEEIYYQADYEDDTEIILGHFQKHLHDQHWREVLLLLISKLSGRKAEKAIRKILNAGSEYEKWLHRDLLFAGWCLTEDPADLKMAAPELVGEILDRLVEIEIWDTERNGTKAREEVSKIIHRLGGTAFESEIWERLNDHAGTNDQFRLLGFQASLGQEERAIETLFSLLKGDDFSFVSSSAAVSLGQLGNASTQVVAGLLSLLNDDSSSVRSSAALSLGRLGNASTQVVAGLLTLLNDDSSSVRSRAALSLGQLGNRSTAVLAALLTLLKGDNSSSVRSSAAASLVELGNPSTEVIAELFSLLKDDDPFVRSSAAASLGQSGNGSTEVIAKLLSLLKGDDSSFVLSSVAESLGQLGNASTEVIAKLLSLLKDDDSSSVRSSAAASLSQLGNASTQVVAGLLTLVTDDNPFVRYGAAASLGQLGNKSTQVVTELLTLLTDENPFVRYGAAESLGQLGNASTQVMAGLLTLLTDDDSDVLSRAASSLIKLGNASMQVVAILLRLLKNDNYFMRCIAAESLGQLNQKTQTVLPEIVQWIETQPDDVPIGEAIDALWAMIE